MTGTKIELLCGNSDEVLFDNSKIKPGSVDLTVTSPPYDSLRLPEVGGGNWTKQVFIHVVVGLYLVTKPGGTVVWVVNDQTKDCSESGNSFRQALFFKKAGFLLNDTMIWNKKSFTAVGALSRRYGQTFEYMFVFTKGPGKTFNPIKDRKNLTRVITNGYLRNTDGSTRLKSNIGKKLEEYGQRFAIWDQPPNTANRYAHYSTMPEQLAADHIVSWSNPGDVVLDPFVGSGTTGAASARLGRHFIGIDCNPGYIKMSRDRINQIIKK